MLADLTRPLHYFTHLPHVLQYPPRGLLSVQDEDRVWIVTELCSGGDLEHFIKVHPLTETVLSVAALLTCIKHLRQLSS